jgi:hypothetical protein
MRKQLYKNQRKYKLVKNRLKETNGVSTGIVPNHVRKKNVTTKYQNVVVFFLVVRVWRCEFSKIRINKIKIDISKATTPPSLFGIARRMAYANRKYHSGWMWVGVTNGLAGVKLSGSIRENGLCVLRIRKTKRKRIRLVKSL